VTRWHCPLYKRFVRRCWNDEYFLYNPGSGQTHLLNQMALDILDLLAGEPLNSAEIQRLLAETWEIGDDARHAFAGRIEQHLGQLRHLGLISDGRFDDRRLLA